MMRCQRGRAWIEGRVGSGASGVGSGNPIEDRKISIDYLVDGVILLWMVSLLQLACGMKFAAMSAVSLLLLLMAIFVFRPTKDSDGEGSSEADRKVMPSERGFGLSDRTKERKRSFKELMAHFPYAGDRLEELYLKYQNLRPAEVELAEGETLIDELNRLFREMGDDLKFPSEMSAQLSGRDKWNEEMVGKFLDERKEALERLLKVCELSTGESTFRYSIFEGSPEILHGLSGSKLLSLALMDAIRSGDGESAGRYLDALGQLEEAVSRPFRIHSLLGSAITRQTQKSLASLAEAGFDVSDYVEPVAVPMSPEAVLESLRREVGGTVSFLEAAKGGNPQEFIEFWATIVGSSFQSENSTDSQAQLVSEELETMSFDTLQENYAEVVSNFLSSLPASFRETELDETVLADFDFRIEDQGVPEARALVLAELLGPTFQSVIQQSIQSEQTRRELLAHSAMQQAVAAGVAINRVEDLVPQYLPTIPVNAETGEEFVYDTAKGALDFGGK